MKKFLLTLSFFIIGINVSSQSGFPLKQMEDLLHTYQLTKDDKILYTLDSLLSKNKEIGVDYYKSKDSVFIDRYVDMIYKLSSIYIQQNKLIVADQIISQTEKKMPQDYASQRLFLMQKGLIYLLINNISTADNYILNAKRLFEDNHDIYSEKYAECLYRLALVRQQQERYAISNFLAMQAMDLMLELYEFEQLRSNYLYLSLLNCLGMNYELIGNESLSHKIEEEIRKMSLDKDINGITLSFKRDVLPKLQVEDYEGVVELVEKKGYILSFMSREYRYRNFLLTLYLSNDNYAVQLLKDYIKYIEANYKEVFGFYSEREREGFWHERSHSSMDIANAICWKFLSPQSQMLAYNISLYTKSIATKLSNLISNHITGYPLEVQKKYELWKDLKNKYSIKGIQNDSLEYLSNQICELEREIISSLRDLDGYWGSIDDVGKEIHSYLNQGDLIIDFIIIPEFSMVVQNGSKNLVKKEYYGAIIDHPDFISPQMVRICERDSLDTLVTFKNGSEEDFINNLYDINNNSLYNVLLKPLLKYIQKSKTVYFCTTGLLHKVNFKAIPCNGQRIMDITKLIQLSSPSIIADLKLYGQEKVQSVYSQAQIIGGVQFESSIDTMSQKASYFTFSSMPSLAFDRVPNRSGWDFLPGSLYEALEIDSILNEAGIKTYLYTGTNASEEIFKGMNGNSPDIIHLSTHGFFISNNNPISPYFYDIKTYAESNLPMQYCGVVLSGANNIWTGEKLPIDIEDGVLTAEEISQLDLSNTKLVVLSACETGLGFADDVDGVYGLQRALKIAGVETVLMSLWKISDDATKIMMVEFYKNLMTGKTKYQSLEDAQKYLRQVDNGKYDKPEYWASFIMLDGLN